MIIPFNRNIIGKKEKEAVMSALGKGSISGGGSFTDRVEKKLKRLMGGRPVLATTSGTHALELAALLAGLKRGDEVVMPSYTYPSTANCILKVGAKPIFADLACEGMNAGLEEIKTRVSDKTRAIMVVHYGGLSKDIKEIREFADKEGLILIEDAAQALGTEEGGRELGTWGDFACFSFHGTKNFKGNINSNIGQNIELLFPINGTEISTYQTEYFKKIENNWNSIINQLKNLNSQIEFENY